LFYVLLCTLCTSLHVWTLLFCIYYYYCCCTVCTALLFSYSAIFIAASVRNKLIYIIIVCCRTHINLLFSAIVNCVAYSMSSTTCFVFLVIDLVNVYQNMSFSISTRLNSLGKEKENGHKWSWKILENALKSPGKSWITAFSFLCAPCYMLSLYQSCFWCFLDTL